VKLADFGVAAKLGELEDQHCDELHQNVAGSPYWMAPEVCTEICHSSCQLGNSTYHNTGSNTATASPEEMTGTADESSCVFTAVRAHDGGAQTIAAACRRAAAALMCGSQ
jgi:hypothetical protein